MQQPTERRAALAQLAFAGLIDVQDRSLYNRSYTTGHKAYRARATIELGDAIGWDDAHQVLYAGALDIAVGPRWYSTYEMACNAVTALIEGAPIMAIPYRGTTERERALLANDAPLTEHDSAALIETILREPEPAYIEAITRLLLAGTRPRDIVDALQRGAAQVVLETASPLNFSLPQHCYEYCNTLGWFYDSFDHPQRLKLLYVGASFLNQAADHQRHTGDLKPNATVLPPASTSSPTANFWHASKPRFWRSTVRRASPGAGPIAQAVRPDGAGAAAGPARLPARQRSAQPGNRSVLPGGFHQEPERGSRSPAARLRAAHSGAPQIRRPARRQPPLRRRHGCPGAAVGTSSTGPSVFVANRAWRPHWASTT
ncbi:MAG: hypothetical protein WDO24_11345 [Pseudomonadota bacterium]